MAGRGVWIVSDIGASSSKGEAIRLDASLQELDLEQALGDRPALPDELVEPVLGHGAGS
jgi:hypothetical protein